MKSRLLLATLAVVGLAIIDGATVSAAVKIWDRGAGTDDTNTAGNWDPDGVPGSTDDVIIPACGATFPVTGCPVMNANHTWLALKIERDGSLTTGANSLTVKNTGALEVQCGGVLTVNNASGQVSLGGGGTHPICGEIELTTSLATLKIEETVLLTGGGTIEGKHNSAAILIDGGQTLTSQITIEGTLTIQRSGTGVATFVNNGLVHANRRSTPFIITLDTVTVEGCGKFKVGDASSSDEINFASTVIADGDLAASFTVLDGILDLDTDVITTGRLRFFDGKIEVAANKVFIAN